MRSIDEPLIQWREIVPTTCGPVVCLERLPDTLTRCNHPTGIRRADAWARRWAPEVYVLVLRPGLPHWLFNLWSRRNIPIMGAVATGQLRQDHWSVGMMNKMADQCAFVHEEPTPELRDNWARTQGYVVTSDHVLQGLAPDA